MGDCFGSLCAVLRTLFVICKKNDAFLLDPAHLKSTCRRHLPVFVYRWTLLEVNFVLQSHFVDIVERYSLCYLLVPMEIGFCVQDHLFRKAGNVCKRMHCLVVCLSRAIAQISIFSYHHPWLISLKSPPFSLFHRSAHYSCLKNVIETFLILYFADRLKYFESSINPVCTARGCVKTSRN